MASNNITPKYFNCLQLVDRLAYLRTQDGKEQSEFVDYTTSRSRLLAAREADPKDLETIGSIILSCESSGVPKPQLKAPPIRRIAYKPDK